MKTLALHGKAASQVDLFPLLVHFQALLSKTSSLEAGCCCWRRPSQKFFLRVETSSPRAVHLQQQVVTAISRYDQWHSLSIRGQKRETELGERKGWPTRPELLDGTVLLFLLPAVCTLVITFNSRYCVKHKRNSNPLDVTGSPQHGFTRVYLAQLFHERGNTKTKWWDLRNQIYISNRRLMSKSQTEAERGLSLTKW